MGILGIIYAKAVFLQLTSVPITKHGKNFAMKLKLDFGRKNFRTDPASSGLHERRDRVQTCFVNLKCKNNFTDLQCN